MGTVLLRREGSDILRGLMAVLRRRREMFVDSKTQGDLHVLKSLPGLAAYFFARNEEYEAFF